MGYRRGGINIYIDNGYVPFPLQSEFHNNDSKIRLILAGRYGGKTVAGVNEAIKRLFKYRFGVVVSPTWQMLQDDLLPVFEQYLPMGYVKKFTKNRIMLNNGNFIIFASGNRPDRLRGLHPDWAYFDEAASYDDASALEMVLLGLSPYGKIWATTTPKGFNWVYDRLINNPQVFLVKWTSYDNPYHNVTALTDIESFIQDEKLKKQEIYAELVSMEGLIWNWNGVKYPIPDSYDYAVCGLDAGYIHNSVFEVLLKKDMNVYIVRERVENRKTHIILAGIAQEIEKEYNSLRFSVAAERPELVDEMVNHQLWAEKSNRNVEFGIGCVGTALNNDVLRVCEAPLFEHQVRAYEYKDGKIKKTNDDACDAVRYGYTGILVPQSYGLTVVKQTSQMPYYQQPRQQARKRVW